eukprot:3875267-Pyramimonas_sp.AAC.1
MFADVDSYLALAASPQERDRQDLATACSRVSAHGSSVAQSTRTRAASCSHSIFTSRGMGA